MPYKPTAQTAVHALDQTQQLAAQKQYSWLSGGDVTTTGSTSSIETAVSSGRCVFDGEQITIPGGNHTHPDGDTDDPRWDALCVTDRTGTVEVFTGVPAPTATDEQGDPIRGEPAFSPAPSDNITSEMVCLALVWIPSGATNNADLTDESAGGVAEPVVDRRVYQAGRVDQTTRRATITSSGWHTIASQAPLGTGPSTSKNLANGLFTVRDTQSGRNSATTFWAAHMDAENPTIRVINSSAGSQTRAIQGVRLVSGLSESDNGAEVQVNVQLNSDSQVSDVEYTLQNNYHYGGWWPESWQSGVTPSGYDSTDIYWRGDAHVDAIATQHTGSAQYAVNRAGDVQMRDLQRDRVATKATLSTAQSIPNETTTTVAFDQTAFDHYGAFSGSESISVPANGTYHCDANIGFSSFSSGTYARIDILQNGSAISTNRSEPYSGGPVISTNTISELVAGDRITVNAHHNSGSAVDLRARLPQTFLSIAKLG